jgi:hypothetical protein
MGMRAFFDKIPGWGWAIITLILIATLAIHTMINPIVFGRMVCPERELQACGKIRVVTNEGGHEFYSESLGRRGFFVVPIMNRLKGNHAVHLFLLESIGDKETEVPLGGPVTISFLNVLSQNEVELTVKGFNIEKVEYLGGNIFTLVFSLYDKVADTAENVVESSLSGFLGFLSVSNAHAGDITNLPGFLEAQRTVVDPNVFGPPSSDIFIGQSAPPAADPVINNSIESAMKQAEAAQAQNNLPLSTDNVLRMQVENETGFMIPESHWQDIESPEGLSTYLRARAALAEKHPDLFAPGSGIGWGEAVSKADGLYGEKYIFLPESTVHTLQAQ